MILLYDKNGNFLAKEYENSWRYSHKKNTIGSGEITEIPYYPNAKYASLYKQVDQLTVEKVKDVMLKDTFGNGEYIKYNIETLEAFLTHYRIPANWKGWSGKPLSFVLSDLMYGFDFIRRSTLAEFTRYLDKVNIDLNKIKDGDIHLAMHEQGDSLHYYEKGHITFTFDCGDCVSQRYVRWSETSGEKVYIGVQSVGSDTPITDSAQVDFSTAPILSAPRGVKDAAALFGVPIVSNKRYVAVRFTLQYVNADWIKDYATHKVYNENNVLVDRTVRGFTPVLRSFEIITRKKTELRLKKLPKKLDMPVDGIELSGGTLWDALQKIRQKYPFDSQCFFENGQAYFECAKSLEKPINYEKMLRADDAEARQFNNTTIKTIKHELDKVNVLHCYGAGEGLQQLYVRVPEHGTYDSRDTVEQVFTDTKMKTVEELRQAGYKKIKALRKDDNPMFQVQTDEPLRMFDTVPLVHPKTNKIYRVHVEHERIRYKENVYEQEFGLGGVLFNPMQGVADAIFKDEPEAVREYAYKPFSVTAHAKTGCITLEWEGQEDTYSVKWKKESDTEYNYRQVKGRTSDFNGLENYQPYLFSVAGTYNGAVSEYTQEITAEPVDWATDPNNPDNAVNKAIAARTPKYLGVVETVPANKTAVITKGERLGAVDANAGDWVLMSKTVGGWKVGVCYRWTGGKWEPLTPEKNYGEHYHACMLHICEIEELMQKTGHFGALFAKALVTQEAFIKKLAADQAFLKELIVQKLRIDSDRNSDKDFEAWFDETNGLLIKNNNQEVFKVTPSGFAFMKNAKFEGEIDCQGFKVINASDTKQSLQFSWSKGNDAFTCAGKISTIEDANYLSRNNYFYDTPLVTKHYGTGIYGGDTVRCVLYERCACFGLSVKLRLLNKTGEEIGTISATKSGGVINTAATTDEQGYAYRVSLHDFQFYTYSPAQQVLMPNIKFGKPTEHNLLYRDENGFLKIS
ncbi:hypothetical protein [Treponema sp.]|uniref:hypothetical protein n=1 Tax=Treponema sp. TaxID=166 RepID=UPI003FA33DBF